ncbi:uncharacterized protein LOC121431259 [Lytechinus variegatus]|uniref:uncharacterized protein LOC121431259 n=1 Tax=Lytechinus variegatus TaxID=7654 RepID=UPI001BB27C9F|nr:uncharacterized protein LOC121431259 [Lytechinus variegatus]
MIYASSADFECQFGARYTPNYLDACGITVITPPQYNNPSWGVVAGHSDNGMSPSGDPSDTFMINQYRNGDDIATFVLPDLKLVQNSGLLSFDYKIFFPGESTLNINVCNEHIQTIKGTHDWTRAQGILVYCDGNPPKVEFTADWSQVKGRVAVDNIRVVSTSLPIRTSMKPSEPTRNPNVPTTMKPATTPTKLMTTTMRAVATTTKTMTTSTNPVTNSTISKRSPHSSPSAHSTIQPTESVVTVPNRGGTPVPWLKVILIIASNIGVFIIVLLIASLIRRKTEQKTTFTSRTIRATIPPYQPQQINGTGYDDTSVRAGSYDDTEIYERVSHSYTEIDDYQERYVPLRLSQVQFYRSLEQTSHQ